MISECDRKAIDGWRFSQKDNIVIHSDSWSGATKQVKEIFFKDSIPPDLVSSDIINYILEKLIKIGIVIKDDLGYRTNTNFNWSEYNGQSYETTRYLVSCKLDNIENPGSRYTNVLVDWNGLDISELSILIREKLGKEFLHYSLYIQNMSEIKVKEKLR